ncbi:MAG: S1 RNA-binding domain-containing protein [Oscillospiraceae bacterium]|nr:S1 RNA-binding domain-containing protein [Clostridia bacterium]MBQ8884315.1 S1 RNA-binding domain-containing protein [Oscillospiraceae bacterium]
MQIDIGSVHEGTVTGLTKFGAFVKLENGASGMVHISEVSNEYVSEISEHLSEGDKVKVKVIEINEKGKIGLSIKKALPQPEKPKVQKPKRENHNNRGWKGTPQQDSSAPMSFEDMMAKFKAQSEDKMSDLKRSSDKRGGNTGYRRGPKQ